MSEYSTVIGMDLGDKLNHYCILDAAGEVVQDGRVQCTEAGLRRLFAAMEGTLVAVEAGTHSPWVSRLLVALGHTVLVGNARKLRAVYENDQKSDARDAEMLARIARFDPQLLHPIQHRGEEAQAHLALLKARDCVVRARTRQITHVRAVVKSFGARLPTCGAVVFHNKVREAIPKELLPALEPLVDIIAQLNKTIKNYDKQIEILCQKAYPETELLRSVNGVGPVTALSFVLTLESPERFATSRAVPAYLGLTPGKNQSGASDPQQRITKAGNAYLRRLLVGCAQYILGHFGKDCELRRFGQRIAARGGKNAKKRAVVAVARKLAVILHALWQDGTLYEPFFNSQYEDTVPNAQPAAVGAG